MGDVTTTDVAAAAAFYGGLFGWTAQTDPRPKAGGYTVFTVGGKAVAAASPPPPGQEGVPPHWTVYLASDDVDETAARVQEAGGVVHLEPFDVLDAGRMAVAADPSGAVFGVWQAREHIGAQLAKEPGTLNWARCRHTTAAPRSPSTSASSATRPRRSTWAAASYVVFSVGDTPSRGSSRSAPTGARCRALVGCLPGRRLRRGRRARAGGGRTLYHGPAELAGTGRFAVVADPLGAAFQVIA